MKKFKRQREKGKKDSKPAPLCHIVKQKPDLAVAACWLKEANTQQAAHSTESMQIKKGIFFQHSNTVNLFVIESCQILFQKRKHIVCHNTDT